MLILEVLIGVVFISFFVWQRKNKWLLGGLWLATLLLFANALEKGGGEPLGRQYLKEIGQLSESEKQTMKYYYDSAKYFIYGSEKPDLPPAPLKSKPSWFWWRAWSLSFLAAVITTLWRANDKARVAGKGLWQYLATRFKQWQARREQKRQLAQSTILTNPQPASNWSEKQKMGKTFLASLMAEATWHFPQKILGRFFPKVFR